MANEPVTVDELRQGWVHPLGSLWVAWTQAFNLREFSGDREAMLAVTRTLKALSYAFWPHRDARFKDHQGVERPKHRDERCTRLLSTLGSAAREFLGDNDVVENRPELAEDLLQLFVRTIRDRCFLGASSDRSELFKPREPDYAECAATADRLVEHLLDSLRYGYAYSDMRAELPADFDSPERVEKLRAALRKRVVDFDPGFIDHENGIDDAEASIKDATAALKESLG